MRLTTVAAIGVCHLTGGVRRARHAGGGRRVSQAAGGSPRGDSAATRRQRAPRSEGATLRPKDNRGQSAPVMAGLFWHSTQLLAAYCLRLRRHTQLTTSPLNHQTLGMKTVITYAPAYETHHTVTFQAVPHAQSTDRAYPGIHNSSCFGSLDGVILSAFSEGTYRCGSSCEQILTRRRPAAQGHGFPLLIQRQVSGSVY